MMETLQARLCTVRPTRDANVGTEAFFRERFAPLPETRTRFAQTDSSWLRSKSVGVSTEDLPQRTQYPARRMRLRMIRNSVLSELSKEVQTNPIETRDASVDTTSLPTGHHQDHHLAFARREVTQCESDSERSYTGSETDQSSSVGDYGESKRRAQDTHDGEEEEEDDDTGHYLMEDDVSIEEDYYYHHRNKKSLESLAASSSEGKSASMDPIEARQRLLMDHERIINKELLLSPSGSRRSSPSRVDTIKDHRLRTLSVDNLEQEKKPKKDLNNNEGLTSSRVKDSKSVQIVEQTNFSQSSKKGLIRKMSPTRDLRTQSKVIVEVTQPTKKEISEVTSWTEMDKDGKLSRKTMVTSSKKIPLLLQSLPSSAGHHHHHHQLHHNQATPEPIINFPPSTASMHSSPSSTATKSKRGTPKTLSENCSLFPTRAVSDIDHYYNSLPPPSRLRRSTTPGSMLTPAFSETEIPSAGTRRVHLTDPLRASTEDSIGSQRPRSDNKVLLRPPSSSASSPAPPKYSSQDLILAASSNHGRHLAMPLSSAKQSRRPQIVWQETSNSTVTNEITTDPFKGEDGSTLAPKGVCLTTETTIDSKGKDRTVQTKSRAVRKFDGDKTEPDIVAETLVCDSPPMPRRMRRSQIDSRSSQSQKRDKSPVSELSPRPKSRQGRSSPVRSPSPTPLSSPTHSKSILETSLDDEDEGVVHQTPPSMASPTPTTTLERSGHKRKHRRHNQVSIDSGRILSPDTIDEGLDYGSEVETRQGISLSRETSPVSRDFRLDEDVHRQNMASGLSSTETIPKTDSLPVPRKAVVPVMSGSQDSGIKRKSGEGSDKPSAEMFTRITRTNHPEELRKTERGDLERHRATSRTVLEQDVESNDGLLSGNPGACRISSSVTMDTLSPTPDSGTLDDIPDEDEEVIGDIEEDVLKKRCSSPKHPQSGLAASVHSYKNRSPSKDNGDVVTETKFQRVKSPVTTRGHEETTWEYSMECSCVNGQNTSVRTSVKHKRTFIPYAYTQYETSV